jgi:hypothetical protein
MRRTILGISPFYHIGALGHYERVHSALARTFEDQNSTSHTSVLYFGCSGFKDRNDFISCVSKNFQDPSGRIKLKNLFSLARNIDNFSKKNKTFIQVYEGSLSIYLAIQLARLKNPLIYAIINFHQVELFKCILADSVVARAYRFALTDSNRKSAKVKITAESKMSARFIGKKIGVKMEVFPVFTTFSKGVKSKLERRNLILVSGEFDEEQIFRDLSRTGAVGNDSIIFDNRIKKMASKEFIEKLNSLNFKIIDEILTEKEYGDLLNSVLCVWFLYRSQVNLQGSSGRLMDALSFGLEVIVPSESALEETVLEYRNSVKTIDLSTGIVKEIFSTKEIRNEENTGKRNDVVYAVGELNRMWDELQGEENTKEGHIKTKFSRIFLRLMLILSQWAFLQVAIHWYANSQRLERNFARLLLKFSRNDIG